MKKIGVIIPVHNCLDYTRAAIQSIVTKHIYQLIVIDDHSTDGTKSFLNEEMDTIIGIIDPEGSTGLAFNWNLGIRAAMSHDCNYFLLINNDILLHPQAIDNLVERLDVGDIVLVTAMNVAASCPAPASIFEFPIGAPYEDKNYLDFSCFMINAKTIEKIGWFDTNFGIAYFEDCDYHARIALIGARAISYNQALFYHYGSRTLQDNPKIREKVLSIAFAKNHQYFLQKWGHENVNDGEAMRRLYYKSPFNKGGSVKEFDEWPLGRDESTHATVNLAWVGMVYSSAGYGHEARSLIHILSRKNFNIKAVSIGFNDEDLLNPQELMSLRALEQTPMDLSRALVVHHVPFDLYRSDIRGRINIVRTMFETSGIPERWLQPLGQIDEIWVPCSFNIDTFSTCGIPRHKLRLVPSGVDNNVFHPAAHPLDLGPKKGFTFLSNFGFTDRKGWDLLLTAYLTEFKPDEDVALLIKTNGIESAIEERIGRFVHEHFALQQLPPFVVLAAPLHNSKLPGLYTACDAFVLPSRGEGWGLPYIEAMACGLPVIGTKWGGNLEYMNEENSYLIEIEGLERVPQHLDTPVLIGPYNWAKPSVEHLRHLMRYVFEHRLEARAKGAQARADISQNWTWEHAAAAIIKELDKYGAQAALINTALQTAPINIAERQKTLPKHARITAPAGRESTAFRCARSMPQLRAPAELPQRPAPKCFQA